MWNMDRWDLMLLGVAGYLAVITLVRLMGRRRDVIIDDLTQEVAVEKKRLKEKQKKDRRRKSRERMKEDNRRRGAA